MKHSFNFNALKSILLIVILFILNKSVMAQVPSDTTKPKVDSTQTKVDTATAVMADTTHPAAVVAATTESGTNKKSRRFSIYAGGNSNSMSGSTDKYNANSGVGYHFGVAWET